MDDSFEDFEVQTSALSAGDDDGAAGSMGFQPLRALPPASTPFRRRMRVVGTLLLALLVALGMIYTQSASAPKVAPASDLLPGMPLAVNSMPLPLGAAPPYCLQGPMPRSISSAIGPLVGGAPVWVAGFDGPRATLHISDPEPATYTRYGWIGDVLWEVGPHFPNAVILQGKNLRDGSPVWFRVASQAATTTLVLNPGAPHAVSRLGRDWAEWRGYIYIAVAGCYSLEAIWPGGQWRFTFAAGRAITPAGRHCVGQKRRCLFVGFCGGRARIRQMARLNCRQSISGNE